MISALLFAAATLHAQEQTEPRYCFSVDYLALWVKKSPVPVPLVLNGFGPTLLDATFEGLPIVIGSENVNLSNRSGARFQAEGWWSSNFGVGAEYLFLPNHTAKRTAASDGSFTSDSLFVLFYDAVAQEESASPISFPGTNAGYAWLYIKNRFQGANGAVLGKLFQKGGFGLSALGGFQWWNFNERLTFKTSSPNIEAPFNVFYTTDLFKTKNNFYGALIGISGDMEWKKLSIDCTGKLGIGATCSSLQIGGRFITDNFGPLETFAAGYFALPTNEGSYSLNQFALAPEVDVNFGFKATSWAEVKLGYSFIYISEILWPGDTMDGSLNTSQSPAISEEPSTTLVGVARPLAILSAQSFWVQGLNVGVSFKY